MSVYTQIIGEITIDPPIPVNLIPADSPLLRSNHHGKALLFPLDIAFEIETDAETGQAVAVALVPGVSDARKIGGPATEIQDIIDAFPKHTFEGELELVTEHYEKAQITVEDGHATQSDWEEPDDEDDLAAETNSFCPAHGWDCDDFRLSCQTSCARS